MEKCDIRLMYLELPERRLLFEISNVDNINSVLAALKYDPIGNVLQNMLILVTA